jgi:hypothetical protein
VWLSSSISEGRRATRVGPPFIRRRLTAPSVAYVHLRALLQQRLNHQDLPLRGSHVQCRALVVVARVDIELDTLCPSQQRTHRLDLAVGSGAEQLEERSLPALLHELVELFSGGVLGRPAHLHLLEHVVLHAARFGREFAEYRLVVVAREREA